MGFPTWCRTAARWLTHPTPDALRALLERGPVEPLTLAPERAGGLDAVWTLTRAGVLVSVGHSDAIGRPDLGRIAGAAADLVWLGDDLRAWTTWVAGEIVFRG